MTDTAHVEKLNESMVLIRYHCKDTTLKLSHIRENFDAAYTLVDASGSGLMVVTGQRTLLSTEARQFIIKNHKNWKGLAIKVNNAGQRLMGNVIINLMGKGEGFRLFTDEKNAHDWLVNQLSNMSTTHNKN